MKTYRLVMVMVVAALGGCGGGGGGAKMTTVDAAVEAADVGEIAEVGIETGPIDVALTRVNYRIASVTGTFGGDGMNVVDATRTDTLAANTCTFMSAATPAAPMQFIAATDLTKMLSVTGTVSCPPGMATSTLAAACTAGATTSSSSLFQGSVEMAGWQDDDVVTFKILAPPGALPACNYAGVVQAASQPWGIAGTTTAGKFKALMPFSVRFMGANLLMSGTNTSNVSWDFTMMVEPSI